MSTPAIQIQNLAAAIEEHHRDLRTLYGDLGKASVECKDALAVALLEKQHEWEHQEEIYHQLSSSLKQFEDRTRKLKQVQKDLKLLSKTRNIVGSQLGAIAYESYGKTPHSETFDQCVGPLLENSKRRTSFTFLQRRLLSRLFLKLGEAVLASSLEGELYTEARQPLFSQIEEYRRKAHLLGEELALHQSALAQLKSAELQTPRLRLESYNQNRLKAQKAYEEAAVLYGVHVYESQKEQNPLTTQISLHRTRIKQLEVQIQEKQNQIKVEELETQIEIEEQKIAHLADQIGALRTQIEQLNGTIAKKRREIRTLEGSIGDG